jgi:hypothetical protein
MIVILSSLALIVGTIVMLFALISSPSEVGVWVVGIVLVALGAGGFVVLNYQKRQRAKAGAEREQKRREEEARREAFIRSKHPVWGEPFCDAAIAHEVQIGMMPEIVIAAWGEPSTVEEKVITAKRTKELWVYATPEGPSKNVWFTEGRVSKIDESP